MPCCFSLHAWIFVCNALCLSWDGKTLAAVTHCSYFRFSRHTLIEDNSNKVLIKSSPVFPASVCIQPACTEAAALPTVSVEMMGWARTCLEVGDDRAAGQGSFGRVQGHGVAGARLEVGQLVLLLVALHEERVSRHCGSSGETTDRLQAGGFRSTLTFSHYLISTLSKFFTFKKTSHLCSSAATTHDWSGDHTAV